MIKIGESFYKEVDIEDLSKNELIELVGNPDQEEVKKKNWKVYKRTNLNDISKQELVEYIEHHTPHVVTTEKIIYRDRNPLATDWQIYPNVIC